MKLYHTPSPNGTRARLELRFLFSRLLKFKARGVGLGPKVRAAFSMLNLSSHLAWFGVAPLLVVLRGVPARLLGYGACFRPSVDFRPT